MAHTQGPWTIREHTVGHPTRRAWIEINAPIDGGRMEHPICRIPSGFTNQDEDARMICAAPELLEACERSLAVLTTKPMVNAYELGAINALRAAIEKATGL